MYGFDTNSPVISMVCVDLETVARCRNQQGSDVLADREPSICMVRVGRIGPRIVTSRWPSSEVTEQPCASSSPSSGLLVRARKDS